MHECCCSRFWNFVCLFSICLSVILLLFASYFSSMKLLSLKIQLICASILHCYVIVSRLHAWKIFLHISSRKLDGFGQNLVEGWGWEKSDSINFWWDRSRALEEGQILTFYSDRISRIDQSSQTDTVKYCFSYCRKDCQLLTKYLCIMWQVLIIKLMFHTLQLFTYIFLLFTLLCLTWKLLCLEYIGKKVNYLVQSLISSVHCEVRITITITVIWDVCVCIRLAHTYSTLWVKIKHLCTCVCSLCVINLANINHF